MTTLDEINKTLREYFIAKPVKRVWLFGSYARGAATYDSDIDILVDYGKVKPSLLKMAGMKIELEDIFKKKVDLVPEDCLYENLRPYVDKDKILIYERD